MTTSLTLPALIRALKKVHQEITDKVGKTAADKTVVIMSSDGEGNNYNTVSLQSSFAFDYNCLIDGTPVGHILTIYPHDECINVEFGTDE